MRRWLAPVHFHLGGLPQWLVTRVAANAISVVFPRRGVWLNKNFLTLPNPRHHLVHKLAHVLDNRLGPKALPAAITAITPALNISPKRSPGRCTTRPTCPTP